MKSLLNRSLLLAAVITVVPTTHAIAHDGENHLPRVDDHAPIDVMADHYHKKGEWMISARTMNMDMDDPASTTQGPQKMSTDMAMIGFMYAFSDKVTLAVGTGWQQKSMNSIMMGMHREMKAKGLKDLKVNLLTPLHKTSNSRLVGKIGLSLPVGEDNEMMSMGGMQHRMSQNMQPGTGSYGLLPALTYSRYHDSGSFGGQVTANIWLDDNKYGTKAGDSWQTTVWTATKLSEQFSLSGRLSYEYIGAAKAPMSFARKRLRAFAGVNFINKNGHRFAAELGLPVAERKGQNPLETGVSAMLGYQKAW